jgi:hypothetical protein
MPTDMVALIAGMTHLTCGGGEGVVEQGDEADEAGASDGASQLIPGVRRTVAGATR